MEKMKTLERTGTCNRCGECCEGCHHDNDDGVCPVWDEMPTDRGCRVWPTHPFEVPPYCAFKFYDAETGEEVIGYKNYALLEKYAPVNEAC